MRNEALRNFIDRQGKRISQHELSQKQAGILSISGILEGAFGSIAITGGLIRFESPNPALIIGGALVYAAGITTAIPVRRFEERERKLKEENDLKAKESLVNPIVPAVLPEIIVFTENKL